MVLMARLRTFVHSSHQLVLERNKEAARRMTAADWVAAELDPVWAEATIGVTHENDEYDNASI